jgi:hypothetical protein
MAESELIFEVREDEVEGAYTARALSHSIFTEANTMEESRANVLEVADAFFDESKEASKVIRLHYVWDEVLTR